MDIFNSATRRWFEQNFAAPTPAQARGWPVIAAGDHCLITAPTGSGKTLAAFLWSIDRLMTATADHGAGPRVVYVSPLKALVYDIERNLRAPLAGIAAQSRRDGPGRGQGVRSDPTPQGCAKAQSPSVDIRTGDTPQRERRRQLEAPGDILVTTPESLYLMLGSRFAEHLAHVHTAIVDEVHSLAPTKRGAHLALSLERLAAICVQDPQRIGLSATVRPLEEAALWLGGDREVKIVDAAAPPRLDLSVRVPVADMEHPPEPAPASGLPPPEDGSILGALYAQAASRPPAEKGMWSAIYPAILDLIRTHESTICFVNSRGLAERLCQRLNELAAGDGDAAAEPLVRAHHGSVSHDQRAEIEEGLKRGSLKAIVATSSLEMGIDMGSVDQVLLVESPGSVARGLQRVGRAGHGVGEVSSGRIFPKFRGDLLECAVIAGRMLNGELEPFRMPRNALDCLAQQLAAHCVSEPRGVDELQALVTRAGPYRELSRGVLESVLDMLSGRYPGTDLAELRPLLSWDRTTDTLAPRKGAALTTRLNAGTIPDRGHYGVHLGAEGPRLGELDEEMVYETKAGDCILLGASTWRVEEITRDRVVVSPAPGEPGRLPFWRGDGPGRPVELGRAIGTFCRELVKRNGKKAIDWVQSQAPLDELAARNLVAYCHEQRQATGEVPSDRTIVVERFRDELGDWRICILSPFGARIHAPWAMALQWVLGRRAGFEVQVMYSDDGLVLRLADGEDLPALDDLLPEPELVEDRITEVLADTALFASLFRENAGRALLLPRKSAKGRQPLWAQRLRSQSLLATVRRYPTFPIVIETYRQALGDRFDLPGLKSILAAIRSRVIRVHEVETRSASPFARSLVFAYVAAYLYEQDSPLAERRVQALTLDRALLAELLGDAALRALIDPDVLTDLERGLQHLAPERRARDADAVHDLLRRLGDLAPSEIADRWAGEGDVVDALARLEAQRRAVVIPLADARCWIAAEDAGLYRDALGAVPPSGLPDAFLAPVIAPLEQLLRRYARTHGPFTTREPAVRLGLSPSHLEPVLRLLETRGELVCGEIRPAGSGPEWCDAEVLRRLRRRTLARARDAVSPVDAATLGRFLPAWHGIGEDHRGADRLPEAVAQLAGLALPFSLLDRALLPARVPGYRAQDLDLLAATGQVVWVGRGAMGPRDGRIALYPRGSDGLLDLGGQAPGTEDGATPDERVHQVLLERLARGASFLMDLMQAVEQAGLTTKRDALESALWDLVWAGRITNDTFAPLRALGGSRGGRRGREPALAGGRWSLVGDLLPTGEDASAVETRRLLALARRLLERYGVLSREAVQAEGIPGGFGPLYRVLKQMEETGQVRRGWFVDGLSGAQFALAGVVDRLRAERLDERPIDGFGAGDVCVLAAMDPANPYGALIPWPEPGGGTPPRRINGAWVILVVGAPVVYLAAAGRAIQTFPGSITEDGGELPLALAALRGLKLGGRKRLLIQHIDGQPALDSALRGAVLAAGFEADYDALAPIRSDLYRAGIDHDSSAGSAPR